jgi:hypothetical protein
LPFIGGKNTKKQKKVLMKNLNSNKLLERDYLKIILAVVTFLVSNAIISDWEHFKSGLFGLSSNF